RLVNASVTLLCACVAVHKPSSLGGGAEFCEPTAADQAPIPFLDQPMVPICRRVYVEPAITPAERERLKRDYDDAARYVAEVLGPWRSPGPLAIFCKTDDCRLYFGGASRRSRVVAPGEPLEGAGYAAKEGLTIVMGRSDPAAREVLVHEMVH